MGNVLPQVYELTYFDEDGAEIDKGPSSRKPLLSEPEKEVQFMERAYSEFNAATYSVRMLRPEEVKDIIKAQKKLERQAVLDGALRQLDERLGITENFILMNKIGAHSPRR